jgi:ribosomal protein S21
MGRVPDYLRKGHGTEARARRHYRDGDKPLVKHCRECADAQRQARRLRGYGRAA